MKTIFCGTPDFAVPTLTRLLDSPFRPSMVVTQPDRKRGRGQKVVPSPVKTVAVEAGIPVYQPEKFNSDDTWRMLEEVAPELAIIVAYSAKISKRALDSVPKGWLNLHPSLLPKYRGAAPMQWALMEGEERTGVTTFFLNEAWDAGPICLQEELEILPEEDYGSLSRRCAEMGAELVLHSAGLIAEDQEPRTPQDDLQATFAPLIKKEETVIDWRRSSREIKNRIRGLTPIPGARTFWNESVLKIQRSLALNEDSVGALPGEVLAVGPEGVDIQTGEGRLRITKLQPENKKPMEIQEFLNGYRLEVGSLFSNPQA
ncbi:MAG: methionyl-tRNA formyltransferase [Candidatus Omnitrophica bacterium]|nr:methionyl-tRNA formyltransferase [Candidatus Omnitrophota bacterium]